MSKLTERQLLILTIAVTVLIAGGLFGLIFKDRTEIDETNSEIEGLDARIRRAEIEIRKIPGQEDKILVYRAVEDDELQVLPTKQEIAGFHRDLSGYLQKAGLTFQDLPESTPVDSGLAKGISVTRTILSCQGDSTALLSFLNEIENDDRLVAVKGLKIQSKSRRTSDDDAAPIHDIQVHLETYFYNAERQGFERNKIPGEEARLQNEKIREQIASFTPERPETYTLRPASSRRDPLVDPRRVVPVEDPAEIARRWAEEEVVVLELEQRVDVIDEKVEQERALLEAYALFRADQLSREVDTEMEGSYAVISQVTEMGKVTLPELVQRVDVVHNRLDELKKHRKPRENRVTQEVAERTLADIRSQFEQGAYEDVSSEASRWFRFIDGKHVDDAARPASEAIGELRQRSKTLDEFGGFLLKVTGTIVHPVDPKRSVALINGMARHTGDRLDEAGEVEVGEISRGSVVFLYKGEAIKVDRNAKSDAARTENVKTSYDPR